MANIIQDKRSTKLIAENQLCEGKFEISGAIKKLDLFQTQVQLQGGAQRK